MLIPTTQKDRRHSEKRPGLLARMPIAYWEMYQLGIAAKELRDAIYEEYDADRRTYNRASPELLGTFAEYVGTRAGVYMHVALEVDQHLESIGR